MFGQEIQDAKKDLILEREEYPANLPYFSGRAMSAKLKKTRLEYLKQLLDEAEWMWITPVSHTVNIIIIIAVNNRSMKDKIWCSCRLLLSSINWYDLLKTA